MQGGTGLWEMTVSWYIFHTFKSYSSDSDFTSALSERPIQKKESFKRKEDSSNSIALFPLAGLNLR
jgi:hypothetical protein